MRIFKYKVLFKANAQLDTDTSDFYEQMALANTIVKSHSISNHFAIQFFIGYFFCSS